MTESPFIRRLHFSLLVWKIFIHRITSLTGFCVQAALGNSCSLARHHEKLHWFSSSSPEIAIWSLIQTARIFISMSMKKIQIDLECDLNSLCSCFIAILLGSVGALWQHALKVWAHPPEISKKRFYTIEWSTDFHRYCRIAFISIPSFVFSIFDTNRFSQKIPRWKWNVTENFIFHFHLKLFDFGKTHLMASLWILFFALFWLLFLWIDF